MFIATFNVNSVRARLPILEKWLNDVNPDFLFMQETKTQNNSFPAETFNNLGYESFYNGEKSYNGVAVLVKKKFSDVNVSFGFNDENTQNFDTRVLTLKYKNLTVLNTYVPQGKEIEHPDFEIKKKFFARVKNIIERENNNLFLWLGDLNVAPTEIDVTHPENKKSHVCFCDEIREIFNDTKKSLVDILRLFNKNSGVYTFFDYRVKDAVKRNIGWRIDLMLASESLSKFALNCYPDTKVREWERPSDHVPLIADFNL